MVNTYITASGALLALALIHLKTNNNKIAERLVIPATFEQMDHVRPQLLV
jgi:hypothetical protein